jgi:ubiquinone/menaquinone biosynthesis C-methylase UbiE
MSRVLEPEVMDSQSEAHDYDSMDHGEVNRRFVSDFLTAAHQAGLPPDAPVLDLGTGTAQIPIELCRQNPRAQVWAIDLAEPMLERARANVAAAGLNDQIRLERHDAKQLPFAAERFAAVISNSIVHHIPEPGDALAEALRVVQSRGVIFVRDLARPLDSDAVRHLVDTYAAGCNDHQRQLFASSLHAALSVAEVRALVTSLGYEGRTVTATSDRHWTWIACK